MIFTPTPLAGAYLIDLEKKGDDRGFFARAFCENEFTAHGLVGHFCQVNNSLSAQKGTLRGMHYQLAPKAETKLVRCIRGSLYDMILDLRDGSPTFGESFGAELTAENRRMMYVPKGFAHGFLTLVDTLRRFISSTNSIHPNTNAASVIMIQNLNYSGPRPRRSFLTRTRTSGTSIRLGTCAHENTFHRR